MVLILLLAALLLVAGCGPVEEILPPDYTASAQAFREGMADLPVADTFVGREWRRAAGVALADPTPAVLPFIEDISFDATVQQAVAYEFKAVRGHGITVEGGQAALLQLFRRPRGQSAAQQVSESSTAVAFYELSLVAERLPSQGALYFEPREHGTFVLLVQAPPLETTQFRLRATNQALLEWPVQGTSREDVYSVFGDARDGGRRAHHGLDIFAPRGTPIVAASSSTVRRVGVRDRGGNIVTLRDDERGIFLYYAHLDEHRTDQGGVVAPGEVIGTVGNTGNAITTPPHLHIGIYDSSWRRPIDPWYFFVPVRDVERLPERPIDDVGSWVRVRRGSATIHEHPDYIGGTIPSPARFDARRNPLDPSYRPQQYLTWGGPLISPPPTDAALRVEGSHGPFLRVEVASGIVGYVEGDAVEAITEPIEEYTLQRETPVLAGPAATADLRGSLSEDSTVSILAYAGEYGLVLFRSLPGWIPLGRLELLPAG